jgi:hypothetical protein
MKKREIKSWNWIVSFLRDFHFFIVKPRSYRMKWEEKIRADGYREGFRAGYNAGEESATRKWERVCRVL